MPGIYLGGTAIKAMMLGEKAITRAYLGETLVWSANRIRDDFNRADGDLGVNWVISPSIDGYKPSVVGNVCRLGVPDGLVSLQLNGAHARYVAALDRDDGYVEFRIGSQGSGPSLTGDLCRTTVLARGSNNAVTGGVGVQMDSSTLRIVRRAGVDTVVKTIGTFGAGDVIRHNFVGNVHTFRRNGSLLEEWDDENATAPKGTGNRSLIISVQGSKDLLGPRRFGPAIDYVEMG
ncbi:Uncharacterised protein [Mycobacteroides abscessus subsp. massiliense]|uniref:hypothetical protein n=1 Tax=Mycobacteroides abscessus TaxID=36809 RepID=UPI0009A6D165|nr:hypothetical protein [Mycobacteroides abscessus]SLE68159.1 Uncharacterised protein [Mycobacteroides abscessus subsp. massiliense]